MILWLKQETPEAIRLFGKALFQPHRLTRELQAIHPDLKRDDDPIRLLQTHPTDAGLRTYTLRVIWVGVIIPVLALLAVWVWSAMFSETHAVFVRYASPWFCGWVAAATGQAFRVTQQRAFLLIAACLFALGLVISFWLRGTQEGLDGLTVIFPLAFGAVAGIVFLSYGLLGVVLGGVIFGVAYGLPNGIAFAAVFGVLGGTALSVLGGAGLGILGGLAAGVLGGVAFGESAGIAIGVGFLVGSLRILVWVLEAIWMVMLKLTESMQSTAALLRCLPQTVDHVMFLPLPFTHSLLLEAHRKDPIATREGLKKIVQDTKHQVLLGPIFAQITSESIQAASTTPAIEQLSVDLEWLPDPLPSTFSRALSQAVGVPRRINTAQNAATLHDQYGLLEQERAVLAQINQAIELEAHAINTLALKNALRNWEMVVSETVRELRETMIASGEILNR
jgi:uncharacterized protein